MRTNIEFKKGLYNLQTTTIVTRRNVTSDFRIHFLCNRTRKNDYMNLMPEKVASRRTLTKMAASYKVISKIFCSY